MTSIWVELSSPSYFEIAVPKDPRRSSPPDAKVEVAVRFLGHKTARNLHCPRTSSRYHSPVLCATRLRQISTYEVLPAPLFVGLMSMSKGEDDDRFSSCVCSNSNPGRMISLLEKSRSKRGTYVPMMLRNCVNEL